MNIVIGCNICSSKYFIRIDTDNERIVFDAELLNEVSPSVGIKLNKQQEEQLKKMLNRSSNDTKTKEEA